MKLSKTFGPVILAFAFSFAIPALAIEGLHLSVQSSNVLLSWPSTTDETYVVQSLQALATTDTWTTVTDGFPAALNTNLTVFVASNAVSPMIWITNYSAGGTNSGGMIPPGGTNGSDVFGYATGFYRVVRDGVHIFGMTNGMVLSGTVQLPIEFAVDSTDEIVGVTFYDTNNNPLVGAYATPGQNGGWVLNWNTSMFPNGADAVEAELDFAGTNDPVVSVPVTVAVTNLISFPNYLTQEFGSQMWIYAQTTPNADVGIDIYDETNAYLGSFYPTSDGNGIISFIWDLTDGNGNTFTDTNFTGVFTVESSPSVISKGEKTKSINSASPNFPTPSTKETLVQKIKPGGETPGSSSSGSAVTIWTQEPKWTPNNYWIIGVGDMGTPVAFQIVYGGVISPNDYYGVIGTLEGMGVHMAPGNQSAQWNEEWIVTGPASRAGLLSYLASLNPRYENFFWFGHGNEDCISADQPNTTITADQIAFALGNVPLSYGIIHAALHPYRFTWFEACNTAIGNFCESFAIPAQDLSTNNFIAAGLMSRAYFGYKNEILLDTSDSDGVWQQRSLMYHIFLENFLTLNANGTGNSLAALVYAAQNNLGPFAANVSGDPYRMDSSGTSYGATDMIYPELW